MDLSQGPWRRKQQPTPVFLPGEFYRQRSLASYCPWGPKESDMTEWLILSWGRGMCFVPVLEARMRRRPLSWLLSSAQSHSHTDIVLSRSARKRNHSNNPKPKMENFNKNTGVSNATQGRKCCGALDPERHQTLEQLLFPWSRLAWGLVPVNCRWLFQAELQGPIPQWQIICTLFRPLLLWIFYHS